MSELFRFHSERRLNLASRYLGKSPCETCIVRATCYSKGINEWKDPYFGQLEVYLAKPCEEAVNWYKAAETLATVIDFLIKKDSPFLKGSPDEVKEASLRIREGFDSLLP